ncbi:hypothetical protein MTO96_014217 [Rhipicephalus appendiculatus]
MDSRRQHVGWNVFYVDSGRLSRIIIALRSPTNYFGTDGMLLVSWVRDRMLLVLLMMLRLVLLMVLLVLLVLAGGGLVSAVVDAAADAAVVEEVGGGGNCCCGLLGACRSKLGGS